MLQKVLNEDDEKNRAINQSENVANDYGYPTEQILCLCYLKMVVNGEVSCNI